MRPLLALAAFAIVIVGCDGDPDDPEDAPAAPSATVVAATETPAPTETPSAETGQGAIDNRSLAAPARDALFSCTASEMGEPLDRPWVDEAGVIYFAEKPVVEGSVAWDGRFTAVVAGDFRQISTLGLPDHGTGEYPVSEGSDAFAFDANPNAVSEQNIQFRIPAEPIAGEASCLSMGPIGVAISGAVFFNALDADVRDAVANEVFDLCQGHPAPGGVYHYHRGSPCFDAGAPTEHSPIVGYALDGFGIYGPRDGGGSLITNAELDECHGHADPVSSEDGGTAEVYHYHTNSEFPYTLGCFRGAVDLP